jgi:hypothetical protein
MVNNISRILLTDMLGIRKKTNETFWNCHGIPTRYNKNYPNSPNLSFFLKQSKKKELKINQ